MKLLAFSILALALVVAVVGWRATSDQTPASGPSRLCSPYAGDCGIRSPYDTR